MGIAPVDQSVEQLVKALAEAAEGLAETAALLESLGHVVEEAGPQLDGEALGKAALFTISANIAAMIDDRGEMLGRAVREDELEPVTWSMAGLGRTVPMAEYAKANNLFNAAAIQFEMFLDDGGFDMVLAPTISRVPEKLGVMALTADPDTMGAALSTFSPHCPFFNQSDAPAMTVPLHWTAPTETASAGLPIGMMFGGRYGSEGLLYALAGQLERARPWADRRPPVWVG